MDNSKGDDFSRRMDAQILSVLGDMYGQRRALPRCEEFVKGDQGIMVLDTGDVRCRVSSGEWTCLTVGSRNVEERHLGQENEASADAKRRAAPPVALPFATWKDQRAFLHPLT
jgi:hypothetical protein